jgi:hypothetical protein
MSDTLNLATTDNRNIIEDGTTPALTLENASTGVALFAKTTSSGSATVAAIKVSASVASASAFSFAGSLAVSTASGGATVGIGVRVKYGDKYYWMYGYENIA